MIGPRRLHPPDLVTKPCRPLKIFGVDCTLELVAKNLHLFFYVRCRRIRRQIDFTQVLRASVHTPEEASQIGFVGRVAVRTTQPARLAEVFKGKATEGTRSKRLRRILGARCVRELSQKSCERKVDGPLDPLAPFDGRALLTEMRGLHLVAYDLCEMYDRVVSATLIAGFLGLLAFHRSSSSTGFVKPAVLQFEDPVGPTSQFRVVRYEDHAESLALLEVKQKIV